MDLPGKASWNSCTLCKWTGTHQSSCADCWNATNLCICIDDNHNNKTGESFGLPVATCARLTRGISCPQGNSLPVKERNQAKKNPR
ncbi:hypothetical protein RB195_011131 [Necator americanus]|uniref:Thrombospondin type 1 domain protein n=1 Tax=Necator americanus TaxID=51031 RepID=A0ABR1D128_NECAM